MPEFEFRKFNAEGTWDHSRPVLLGPKSKDGVQGYQLITPLVRRDGSTILVDRGFVSRNFTSGRQIKDVFCPTGNVKILGILRTKLQNKNLFTPENKPETGEWYWFDLNQLAEYFGKNNKALQPVFLEEVFGLLFNFFLSFPVLSNNLIRWQYGPDCRYDSQRDPSRPVKSN